MEKKQLLQMENETKKIVTVYSPSYVANYLYF
jgi:hypothetical protein